MTDNTIIAGALIAGTLLLNGYLNRAEERYQVSATGNGQTAWRIDMRSGRISLCGSILDGASFSKMQTHADEAMLNALRSRPVSPRQPGESPDVDALFPPQIEAAREAQQLYGLSQPRCTEWKTAD